MDFNLGATLVDKSASIHHNKPTTMSSPKREYSVIITEMPGGRPADGSAPFSIMESSHCTCDRVDGRTRGFDFVNNHCQLLGRFIAAQGLDITCKLIHWGGPKGDAFHASVVGPFYESAKALVHERLIVSGISEHCEIIYVDVDLHEIPVCS